MAKITLSRERIGYRYYLKYKGQRIGSYISYSAATRGQYYSGGRSYTIYDLNQTIILRGDNIRKDMQEINNNESLKTALLEALKTGERITSLYELK